MANNVTEIVGIIDESGSMHSTKSDVIGGFNGFIEEQRGLEGKANVSITLFNTTYRMIENGRSIDSVMGLDENNYRPGGMTALFDAIGKTIDEVDARISKLKEGEKPSKVIFLIMTDGHENSSCEYTADLVTKRIKEKKEQDWQFIFIGADEKAIGQAKSMGLGSTRGVSGQSINTTYTMGSLDSTGYTTAFRAMSTAVANYRTTGDVGNWTEEPKMTTEK